jgi:uncharacterized protein YndB with AHSA1/START domain
MTNRPQITVSVLVRATPERAWKALASPESITKWNFASPDWHCPRAQSDLREGGAFCYRMEARDGTFGFDFEGRFLKVSPPSELHYSLGTGREVLVRLTQEDGQTRVSQTFAPEETHSLEQQRAGWQSILDNYKTYVDTMNSGAQQHLALTALRAAASS